MNDRLDHRLNGRRVDDFRWAVGVFQGDVESCTNVDLGGHDGFGDHWELGVDVASLLDNEHRETFGGDLIGRRALAHVVYRW